MTGVSRSHRIHILGASGSGTTTLGCALAEELGSAHFDTDDYYWMPTIPPYQKKREECLRQELLRADLERSDSWTLSGSLCGWGDIFIPLFDLVVYLYIPSELRMRRLRAREELRYGSDTIAPGGPMSFQSDTFFAWAARYDDGDLTVRSRMLHEQWLIRLPCRILRLEGDMTTVEQIGQILHLTSS